MSDEKRNAVTWAADVGGAKLRLVLELDDDGRVVGVSTPGYGLPGSGLDALWRCFVKTWDINLRSGRVPLVALQTFMGRQDEMAGPTGDPLVPHAGGHADYFARSVMARAGEP